MKKEQKAISVLGPAGSMISASKSEYRENNPKNLSIFNANVCTKEGKIWWGDLDVTKSQHVLSDLAYLLGEDLYVLYEMDGRFENEESPNIGKYAVKFFQENDFQLSEILKKSYDASLLLKDFSN